MPGANLVEFTTDRPADPVEAQETRQLAFAIGEMTLEIRRVEPAR